MFDGRDIKFSVNKVEHTEVAVVLKLGFCVFLRLCLFFLPWSQDKLE